MTNQATNLTLKPETTPAENQAEIDQEVQSNCQGYLVDPLTRFHLCQACPYHKYWDESKP